MIIIPARLKSSRFENKIMADIMGLPMVIRTAQRVAQLDDVVIATDSQEVFDLAQSYNIKCVITSQSHQSGTDRINEAAHLLCLDDDAIIINVQADEPFIEPEVVSAVIEKVKNSPNNFTMVSCYKKISSELADDPNHVKVVVSSNKQALYFSRAKIPYNRDHYQNLDYFGHLGIYGFTKSSLDTFCSLGETHLEHIEKLEQLRAIANNLPIQMVEVTSQSFGIDTKEDLENALKVFG